MVTYTDLFAYTIVIFTILAFALTTKTKENNRLAKVRLFSNLEYN